MTGRLSIRTRVLIAMFAVFVATLIALGLLVNLFYTASVEQHVSQDLDSRVKIVGQIATSPTSTATSLWSA